MSKYSPQQPVSTVS